MAVIEGKPGTPRGFRYYDLLVGGMVAVLLCSNLIGPAKVCTISLPLIGALSFGAGNLFFPVSYIFDDVLTEVYGYAGSRRAIWAGFGGLVFASFMSWAILAMPPSPIEPFNAKLQPALETVFGATWRIALASMVGYWFGDFANSYVMAKMKILTQGRMLWARTIGSTVVGQAVDTMVLMVIAFGGSVSWQLVVTLIVSGYLGKVLYEAAMTPVTYWVVGSLKRYEGVDTYDTDTEFSPFHIAR